ncbi:MULTISPECIES: ExeM/NucH family extracellular endonuclease [unclassified Microbacterium]|uniref:ExeM/NucH family extracellular endonuclease n=1 Tax=unclassified Microbacterium TaxID=2609290 RepID=UPI00214CC2CC|nr:MULTISPECIES: ExeM/NucH family extracellular endonuclease [unclassified Microbacterium]MCR2808338.1 ExeM/NucH family extracellular endonuclease [Microbacterium sp. zg.B185]WIM19210.1 ExeM/NucH family extracellular endonuclease [Microbacterium sp. zg-B185]
MRRPAVLPASLLTAVLIAGLSGVSSAAGAADGGPVINEFSASTAGTDVEYVELLVPADADSSGTRVLEVEGDAGGAMPALGVVDEVIAFPAPDASGRSLATLPANALENGTVSLLLVTGTVPAAGSDIDADDDGVIDDGLGFAVLDAVAVHDGGAGDQAYGGVVLGVSYDGLPFAPGAASRIPDGADSDAVGDWVRNDFDLAGTPGIPGTLIDGEAANTPGSANSLTAPPVGPAPGEAGCDLEVASIGSVQGTGALSPAAGTAVRVEGTVVGDFQEAGGFGGYYVQDAGDGDPASSDGIFVSAPTGTDVAVGDVVNVTGVVRESGTAGAAHQMTGIDAADAEICAVGAVLPDAVPLTLPAAAQQREAVEGMYVTLPQTLTILEYFEYGRFGRIDVGLDRQMTPTAVYTPGSAEAAALAQQNLAERITIDDGRAVQNPDPAIHPDGDVFTLVNTFRGGDLLTDATGVLDYRDDTWALQPTQGADHAAANPRTAPPEVGGRVTVSSFNVLNYFTTLTGPDARGANDPVEFERQEAKIVAALAQIDADVFGLIEIENNGTALATLTAALNEYLGADVYDLIETGPIGSDVITTALIYKPAVLTPVGDFALMDESKDPRWLDEYNRPGLTQTFADAEGGTITVVVNHLKSKGSDCNAVGDPDTGDGAGNCNITRTQAAAALGDWLATDPTGQGAGRELIIGDLNSYDKEAPIAALLTSGFADLLARYQGEGAYSYVFDGQLGYLDYALAGPALVADVTGAAAWHINADEPSLIDYDMSFKAPAQDALFAPDPYRSSDHDPVIVGVDLSLPDTVAPALTVTADPAFLFPPNGKTRTVTVTADAADDSGEVTVRLLSATAEGSKKAVVRQLSDRSFAVKAVVGATYSFTYEARDAAGNTTTATDTVSVEPTPRRLLAYLCRIVDRIAGSICR